jgi:hypothetical protein
LAAEQLPYEDVTSFLVCAYDWNWRAVLEVILEFEQRQHGGKSPVARGFRDAIFSLNALRQFDLFEHTQEAVGSLLDQYALVEEALPIFDCERIEQIFAAYRASYENIPLEHPLDAFREVFLDARTADADAAEDLVRGPFLGWTKANRVRLVAASPEFIERALLIRILFFATPKTQESIGVRWRIVHTLGRAGATAAIDLLERVLFNPAEHKWIRFGAARSLMERAATAASRVDRQTILKGLIERLTEIDLPEPRSELRNATIIGKHNLVPQDWYEDVIPLLERGLEVTKTMTPDDVINWDKRLEQVRSKLRVPTSASSG